MEAQVPFSCIPQLLEIVLENLSKPPVSLVLRIRWNSRELPKTLCIDANATTTPLVGGAPDWMNIVV